MASSSFQKSDECAADIAPSAAAISSSALDATKTDSFSGPIIAMNLENISGFGVGGNNSTVKETRTVECLDFTGADMFTVNNNSDNGVVDGSNIGSIDAGASGGGSILDTAIPGLAGLSNLGNTCFINSGLQCLLNNRDLVDYFVHYYPERVNYYDLPANSLCGCFIALLNKVWCKDRRELVLRPVEFKEVLGKVHSQFQDYRQHDCQEFLALLLGTLHDQLNTAASNITCNITDCKKIDKSGTLCCPSSSSISPLSINLNSASNHVNNQLVPVVHHKPLLPCDVSVSSPKSSVSLSSNSSYSSILGDNFNEDELIRTRPIPDDVKSFSINMGTPDLELMSTSVSITTIATQQQSQVLSNGSKKVIALPSQITPANSDASLRAIERSQVISSRHGSYFGSDRTSSLDSIRGGAKPFTHIESPRTPSSTQSSQSSTPLYPRNTSSASSSYPASSSNTVIRTREANFSLEESLRMTETPTTGVESETADIPGPDGKFRLKSSELKTFSESPLSRSDVPNMSSESSEDPDLADSTTSPTSRKKKATCSKANQVQISKTPTDEHKLLSGLNRQKRMKTSEKNFSTLNDELNKSNLCRTVFVGKDESHICNDSEECNENSVGSDAKEEWKRYLSVNRSIIVDTFQGQFKSTVKCSNCNHISVTFEPFMYLALPLPFALQRQVVIHFVSSPDSNFGLQYSGVTRFLINVNKYDKVAKVVLELCKLLREDHQSSSSSDIHVTPLERSIVLAEVCDNYILRVLGDSTYLKHVNDGSTCFYAFELTEAPKPMPIYGPSPAPVQALSQSHLSSKERSSLESCEIIAEKNDTASGSIIQHNVDASSNNFDDSKSNDELTKGNDNSFSDAVAFVPPLDSPAIENLMIDRMLDRYVKIIISCTVCLDEKLRDQLYVHQSPSCNCHLCHQCLESCIEHFSVGDKFTCPTCNKSISRSEFVPLAMENSPLDKPHLSFLLIPLYFRVADAWNSKELKLINHPFLLRLPNVLSSMQLYSTVDRYVPFPCPYTLHWVDQKGLSCSRCAWGSSCKGCEIARFGDINLQADEALVIHFDSSFTSEHSFSSALRTPSSSCQFFTDHKSMCDLRPVKNLTLDDCLRAFSSSETLDEDNPWFCPVCKCNQKARKCLTIWKCPATLMVYLKRFIYHGMTSVKVDDIVDYPIESLNMSPYIQDPSVSRTQLYDLQAFVCHSGSVSSGHYTAFAKHCLNPDSNDWYYFNDEIVAKQEPSNIDDRAYILFYTKKTCKPKLEPPSGFAQWSFFDRGCFAVDRSKEETQNMDFCESDPEAGKTDLHVIAEPLGEAHLNVT